MFKVAVLGTAHGHIYHLLACAKGAAGAQVIGVYDDDATRLAEASAKMGIPAFKTVEEILAQKPAVVVIGAVPSQRAGLAEKAMEAGAAALVDKPLALTHEALDKLIATQRRTKKPVVAFYVYRGHPAVLAAKAALKAGRIGKLVRVYSAGPHKLNPPSRPAWHWTKEDNGGALIDIGSHHADMCCFMAEQAPNWLVATQGNFSQPQHRGFQDFGQVQMRFPGGELAHWEVDWLNPASMKNFGDTRIWLQGTEGKIELRMGDETSAVIWTSKEAAKPLDTSAYPEIDPWASKMIEDIAAGRPGPIPQEEVWQTSRVTLYAFESAQAGGKVMDKMKW